MNYKKDEILFMIFIVVVPSIIGIPFILWSRNIPIKELLNFQFNLLFVIPFILPFVLILFDCIKTKNGWKKLTIQPLFLFGIFGATFWAMILLNLVIKNQIFFYDPLGAFFIGYIVFMGTGLLVKRIINWIKK
jgi:hypothetical protein